VLAKAARLPRNLESAPSHGHRSNTFVDLKLICAERCRAGGSTNMERFVAEQNIAHFRDLLWGDLSPDERAVIEKLLAEEEAKLRELKLGCQHPARSRTDLRINRRA
jgi:hypothetical protein